MAQHRTPPPLNDSPARTQADTIDVARLPPRLQGPARWLLSRWVGQFALRTAASCARIELFDRSMAIAAQIFTSVFPILIVLGTWVQPDPHEVAKNLGIPEETQAVLNQAVGGASTTTIGIIGIAIILISATSLARALTRAYAAIWRLPRPKTQLNLAWRWLAAVVALAISLVIVKRLVHATHDLPTSDAWAVLIGYAADFTVALFLPWLLLIRQIRPRLLVPAGLLYAAAMVPVRLASARWFPGTLQSSAAHYGAIGVAFAYIAWLYVVAFCFLAANVIGHVLATDDSALGRWIRAERN